MEAKTLCFGYCVITILCWKTISLLDAVKPTAWLLPLCVQSHIVNYQTASVQPVRISFANKHVSMNITTCQNNVKVTTPYDEASLGNGAVHMMMSCFVIIPEFPRGIESIELWNRFSRPWKSIEFGQSVHKLLIKYGNLTSGHLFIKILFFTTEWFCRCFFLCVPWIKFWKNEDKWWYYNFFI